MSLFRNVAGVCARTAASISLLAASALAAQAQTVFSPPKNISNTSGNATSQEIAVDAKGNINTVWVDNSPGTPTVFFSRSSDFGATFSAPLTISQTGSSAGGFSPTVAAGPEGNVYVAWTANTPGSSSFSVFFRRSTDGGATFSAPLTISNAGADARLGQMAVDGSGTVGIVWSDNSPGNGKYALFFSHSINGGATFSVPLNLSNNPDVSSFNSSVQIAVDSSGKIDVFWSDQGGPFFAPSSDAVFTRSVDGGATFSAPLVIDSVTGNGPQQPVAVIPLGVIRDTSGNINLLWSRAVSNGDWFMDDVRFARSTDGGASFSSAVQVEGGSGGGRLAQMAVGRKGDVNVVSNTNPFFPSYPTSGGITDALQRSTDGGATFPSMLNTDSCGEAGGAQLGTDANGRINIVYSFQPSTTCSTPTSGVVFTQSSDDSSFSNLQKIGDGTLPVMTVDASGSVYVVWQVANGRFNTNIFFSRSVGLSSVALNLASMMGGTSSTGTVTLSGPAPAGGAVVSLSSSDPSVSVPASVTIAEGTTSATFAVTTNPVATATTTVVSAAFSGVTQTASTTVEPLVLTALALSSSRVSGGRSETATVTLSGPAPAGGLMVTLASNNTSAATVPSSVTVAPGSTSVSFMVSTSRQRCPNSATISASFSGVTEASKLAVQPFVNLPPRVCAAINSH